MYFSGKYEAHKAVFKGKITLEEAIGFLLKTKIFRHFLKKPKLNYFSVSFIKTKKITALELSSKRESDSQKPVNSDSKQTSKT